MPYCICQTHLSWHGQGHATACPCHAAHQPKPIKLAILVSGGVVQGIHSTDQTVDVTVLDCDGDDADRNEKAWEKISANKHYHAVH